MKFQLKKLHIYLIALIALILPNIVLLKRVPQPVNSIFFMAFAKGEVNLDFFSYYKMVFLLTSTIFLVIIFILNRWKKLKWNNSYTFLIIYGFFIIASTVSSPFRELAIRGVGDRYEGVYVLLAYLLLFFAVHQSIEDKEDLKIVLGGIIAGSLVVGGIGIFQYFGYDLFRTDFGKTLILTKSDEYIKDALKFQFGKNTIYSTLYNTNYVGSYMTMMLFLGIGIVLKMKESNNKVYKILSYVYTVFIFANLIGSRSRAGFLGTQATLLFSFIFFFKYVKYYWKNLGVLIVLFVAVFTIMNHSDSKAVGSLGNKLLSIDTGGSTLRDIYNKDGYLYIESINEGIKMKRNKNSVSFFDLNDNKLKIYTKKELIQKNKKNTRKVIYFSDEKYEKFSFIVDINGLILMYDKKINIPIYYQDEKYKTTGLMNKLYEFQKVDRVKIFDGKEKVGSGRAYIWSRTIPLLKDTLFVGYGPDTFSMAFPQNDTLGKTVTYGVRNIIVDKPHSMFLQIGVNTGVLSLINFLIACVIFFISGIISFNKNNFKEKPVAFGLYLGTISYLVTGLFNDSLISVAPIFWIYWGASTYLLYKDFYIREDKKV